MYIILKKRIKYYTKETCKLFSIMAIALGLIIAIILIKYKPTYKVTLAGKEIGYIKSEVELEDRIQKEIIQQEGKNIEFTSLNEMPSYELKLVSREQETDEDKIMLALKENTKVTYKYYSVILNEETIGHVDNIEEAEQAVQKIKEENADKTIPLDLRIAENFTENMEEIGIETVTVAQAQVEERVTALVEEDEKEKENESKKVNGILLANLPVNGTITSRYGAISNRRSGAHTGTDIACAKGTPIKAVAKGKVTFSGRSGSYGNLIKIDHGNGVETWYAHCSKLYKKVGNEVQAGDTIAAVGSTGNSTGNHLHLEIRVKGKAINPQKYLYK
ncbi:MAG: M23 family metallopeptidase [Clostridia bacterium]|nr:M23 family metallopeptidase [Clostridia bacterium]